MKKILGSVKDSFIPSSTKIIDNIADNIRDTASRAVSHGSGNLITKAGDVYKNSDSSKGFAFEHTQEATFNSNAALHGKPYEAIRIPPAGIEKINADYGLDLNYDRLGEPDLIIINTDTGEILKTVQAKVGSEDYVLDAIGDPKYEDTTDLFVINSDHEELAASFDNVSTSIEYDDISSMPISEDTCITIAEHPELASDIAEQFANGSEVLSGAAMGAAIGGGLAAVQSSIKVLAKVYKGEEVDRTLLENSLKEVLEAIKTSALRGALVKVLQIIIESEKEEGSNVPVIIVSIGMDIYPIVLKYLQDEITLDNMIKECGAVALSRGIIITICMTYPPIGLGMLGYSILSTIWVEFELEIVLKEYIPTNPHLEKLKYKVNDIAIKTNDTINLAKIKTQEFTEQTKNNLSNKAQEKYNNTKSQISLIKSKNIFKSKYNEVPI